MKKITDYKLVAMNQPVELTGEVNRQIKAGWQPFEKLTVVSAVWYQPMVKYEKCPEPFKREDI